MKILFALLFCCMIFSCGPGGSVDSSIKPPQLDTNLRLPNIASGLTVDTTLSSLHISRVDLLIFSNPPSLHNYEPIFVVEYDTIGTSGILNVYADSSVETVVVDSIINEYWRGEDVRLIGMNNGIELGIPFHGLHRFPPQMASHNTLPEQYFNLKILADHCEVNDWGYRYSNVDNFFGPFYNDAFSPFDSSSKYPSRARQSVEGLMMEGAAWDGIKLREGPDSAQLLATYNEFVNKLEVFDKAGPFWTLRIAMIDVTYDESITWSQFMNVAALHYRWLSTKRNAAKQYLADYIANKGSDPSQQFTTEDLHLLYPDRLRWNGFVSGEFENRYDANMLTDW